MQGGHCPPLKAAITAAHPTDACKAKQELGSDKGRSPAGAGEREEKQLQESRYLRGGHRVMLKIYGLNTLPGGSLNSTLARSPYNAAVNNIAPSTAGLSLLMVNPFIVLSLT